MEYFLNRQAALSKPSAQPLFKRAWNGVPDTLAINVLYVEFQEEKPEDNSSTTGKGTFNSAFDSNFTLDPYFSRKHKHYLEKHIEFAQDYFSKISNGRLVIKANYFPNPNESSGEIEKPFKVSKRMASYNPVKKAEEKNIVFYERKAEALMSFIAEAIKVADNRDDPDNPFKAKKSSSPNTYQVYLIFHAGHNGLIDGGKLGQLGADTPNDIIDFFTTPDDFLLLRDLSDNSSQLMAQPEDSIGVVVSSGDTITQVMMLSESASQDDVSFGINGILVNQVARQIGMPDTWDRGTGFTQLGYFDLMDVGHLSMSGFIPVNPSAWIRYYMGWEDPVTAFPGEGGESSYDISAALSNTGSGIARSVKIPINDREYLLVENRQKSLKDSVTVYFSDKEDLQDHEFSVQDSITVHHEFLDSLFLDSICNSKGKNCKVNKRRPRGVITGVSSYDIGLPGSGLLVWHVNEWFIEEAIKFGFVNASDEDSKELAGINLVEADGDLSIGQEGKDQLNQSVFDFGSGSDMLPHIRKSIKRVTDGGDTVWKADTVRFITPYNFANTGSWNDGKTHITLEALIPGKKKQKFVKGINFLSGDSIFNFADSIITLKVSWNKSLAIQKKAYWQWPLWTLKGTNPYGLAFLKYPDSSLVFSLSDLGHVQVFNDKGMGAVPVYDTVAVDQSYDSLVTLLPAGINRDSLEVPMYSLGNSIGKAAGTAVLSDTVICVLLEDGKFYMYKLNRISGSGLNSDAYTRQRILTDGVLGPMVIDDQVWIVTEQNRIQSYNAAGQLQDDIPVPDLTYESMAAYYNKDDSQLMPILTARKGHVVVINSVNGSSNRITSKAWVGKDEKLSTVCSDFNRDGTDDILVMGSRGTANLLNLNGKSFKNFPKRFNRFGVFLYQDSVLDEKSGEYKQVRDTVITQDRSAPAVGDIDMDGYPDIVFTGNNRIFAVNYKGEYLKGWPFVYEARQDVGMLYSSPSTPPSVIQSTPLIFHLDNELTVLSASPDGLIWALDKEGRPLTTSSFKAGSPEIKYSGVLYSNKYDWPLSVGGLNWDTTDVPYINIYLNNVDATDELELFAQTGTGGIYAWSLAKAGFNSRASWAMPGGNVTRQHYFSTENLPAVTPEGDVKIIRDFHFYPNPLKMETVKVFMDIGAPASKVRIRVYDLAGMVVKEKTVSGGLLSGPQTVMTLNLGHLGPDIYAALLEVWFDGGSVKKKWDRLGVIR